MHIFMRFWIYNIQFYHILVLEKQYISEIILVDKTIYILLEAKLQVSEIIDVDKSSHDVN